MDLKRRVTVVLALASLITATVGTIRVHGIQAAQDNSGIQKIKGHTTVTKTRILAGFPHSARQQVVRIDQEPQMSPAGSIVRKLVGSARQYVRASDALLVSDYGYGAATPEILFNVRSAATEAWNDGPGRNLEDRADHRSSSPPSSSSVTSPFASPFCCRTMRCLRAS